jgi:hypothetical protein
MVMLLEQWLTLGTSVAFLLVRRSASIVGTDPGARPHQHPFAS